MTAGCAVLLPNVPRMTRLGRALEMIVFVCFNVVYKLTVGQ